MDNPSIALDLNGDGAWSDLAGRTDVIDAGYTLKMTALAGGMSSGRTSVALRIDLPDGRPVIVQTSLQLLTATVRAIAARYPDPTD